MTGVGLWVAGFVTGAGLTLVVLYTKGVIQ